LSFDVALKNFIQTKWLLAEVEQLLGGTRGEEVIKKMLGNGTGCSFPQGFHPSFHFIVKFIAETNYHLLKESYSTAQTHLSSRFQKLDTGPILNNSKACVHMLAQTWSSPIAFHCLLDITKIRSSGTTTQVRSRQYRPPQEPAMHDL
jgi:hypothetical protein